MRCPACGVEAVEEAVYCHKCGARLSTSAEPSPNVAHPAAGPAAAQTQPEQELWRGGYSPRAMTGPWAGSLLISLLLLTGGILWARTTPWWLVVVVLMILPWVYFLAVLCYRRMSVHYVLTTQRLLYERGILRRVSDRIEALEMDDVTFEQSLFERLSGVGTIRIARNDHTEPELVLPGIENVQHVAALFDDARLAERRRRGLPAEQV